MPEATHLIRNAMLDFHYNGRTDGFALQRDVHDWFDGFLTELDSKLSSIAAGKNIVSVDRVQIEVNLAEGNWRREASGKIIAQLADQLLLAKAGIIDDAGYKDQDEMQHFEESFLYFLAHGHLPWHTADMPASQWQIAIANMLENPEQSFVQRVKEMLQHSPVAEVRFSRAVSLNKALNLFASDILQKGDEREPFINDLQSLTAAVLANASVSLIKELYKVLLQAFVENSDLAQAKNVLFVFIQKENNAESIAAIKVLSFRSQTFKDLQQELDIKERKNRVKKESTILQWPLLVHKEKANPLQRINADDLFKEPIFTANAGLVILAAFLPVLFERTKLVAEQEIIGANTAACLVNYLATGNEQMEEYELVLPKILCGISPAVVINTDVVFSKEMKKEASDLLNSVIEYWTILKDTSIAGLRETFLQRTGKLSYKNNEWLLQVEQKQFDMLLEHLPWNISMIKLAWMPTVLKTEWM